MADNNINKIDTFQFIALLGTIRVPQEESMVSHRMGIDVADISLMGKQTQPFTLQSRVNAKTIQDAHDEYFKYLKLVAGDPVNLIRDGFEYTTQNLKFFVKRVVLESVRPRVTAKGGIAGKSPNLAFLICNWTLVASPIVI